jgi:hypothetical protein
MGECFEKGDRAHCVSRNCHCRGSMGLCRGLRSAAPKGEMLQAAFDDLLIFDEADDLHGATAFWTNQGIDLVDLADQPGPAFPESGGGLSDSIRAGDYIIHVALVPFPPQDVAVPAVIPGHLLTAIRDMRAHGGDPFFRCLTLIFSPAVPGSPRPPPWPGGRPRASDRRRRGSRIGTGSPR